MASLSDYRFIIIISLEQWKRFHDKSKLNRLNYWRNKVLFPKYFNNSPTILCYQTTLLLRRRHWNKRYFHWAAVITRASNNLIAPKAAQNLYRLTYYEKGRKSERIGIIHVIWKTKFQWIAAFPSKSRTTLAQTRRQSKHTISTLSRVMDVQPDFIPNMSLPQNKCMKHSNSPSPTKIKHSKVQTCYFSEGGEGRCTTWTHSGQEGEGGSLTVA